MEFSLKEFNPTIAELTELSNNYKGLKILDIDDKEGYEKVKKAQLHLRDKRLFIETTLKKYRQDAIDFQKAVIIQENELIGIIEDTEKELKAERKRIDNEIEIEKRRKILPDRKNELERNGIIVEDEFILNLTSDEFNKFVMDKREEKIKEAQKKIDEDNKKIEDEKNRLEREKELEKVRKETEEKTRIETEDRIKREQKEKEEKEKQEIIDRENKIKMENEILEKEIKYQNWLTENNYDGVNYFIATEGNKKILYRKISEFLIK